VTKLLKAQPQVSLQPIVGDSLTEQVQNLPPAGWDGSTPPSTSERFASAFGGSNPGQQAQQIPSVPHSLMGFARIPSADSGFSFARARSFETETIHHPTHTAASGQPDTPPEPAAVEDAGLHDAFRRHFRRAVTRETFLNSTELLKEAMADCSEGGTFQTSMPMYSVFCTRWTGVFHIALALASLNKFIGCLNLMLHDRKCEGRHFRFTPLEMRGPSGPFARLEGPGVADFGLTYQRCGIGGANVSRDGNRMVASFPEAVGVNGFWFETALQDAAMDPVRFILESSHDGGSWALCGASRLTAVPSASDVALIGWRAAYHNTTLVRGAVETFWLDMQWQFTLDHVLVIFVNTAANLWAFIELCLRRPTRARRIFPFSVLICAGLYLLSAVAYALQGNMSVAAIPASYALGFLWQSRTFRKMHSVAHFGANTCAGFAIAAMVQYLVIFSNAEGTQAIFNGYRAILPLDVKTAFVTSCIFFGIYLWAEDGLARSIADASSVIAADEKGYNFLWAARTASPPFAGALDGIEVLVRSTWGHLQQPGGLRQRDGLPQSRHAQPISSFERIFAQAGVAAPLLRSKVKGWALRSGGMFPVLYDQEGAARGEAAQSVIFERWDKIVRDPELMGRVKWPKVKSEKRVVEKVYRCYAGDVSRLLDCCRCSEAWVYMRMGLGFSGRSVRFHGNMFAATFHAFVSARIWFVVTVACYIACCGHEVYIRPHRKGGREKRKNFLRMAVATDSDEEKCRPAP
jgi:hypothetical protein